MLASTDQLQQGPVRLYAHDPSTLLPLLVAHTPRSLSVLTTIREGLSLFSAPQPAATISSFSSSSSSSSGSSSRSSGSSRESLAKYRVVYATFPPDAIPSTPDKDVPQKEEGAGVWSVVVQMWDPEHVHLRAFCSAESEIPIDTSAVGRVDHVQAQAQGQAQGQGQGQGQGRVQGQGQGQGLQARGEEVMKGVASEIVRIWSQEVILGAVASRWNACMRGILGADEVTECAVYLAPPVLDLSPEEEGLDGGDGRGEEEAMRMGLEFDHARPVDMDIIQRTCDVPRPREYYVARSLHTTVLRPRRTALKGDDREAEGVGEAEPKAEAEAVCWIMHHSDGALGALYTVPTWRRKGLAKMVIDRRLRDHQRHRLSQRHLFSENDQNRDSGSGADEYCHVFRGNLASEALWTRMGWKEGWGVKWMVNPQVGKQRGEVVIHREDQPNLTPPPPPW